MYCTSCGKEISVVGNFCPYCGAKTAVMLPEPKRETANLLQTASMENKNEPLPINKSYKRKNKAVFLIGLVPLLFAIIYLLLGNNFLVNGILPKETKTAQTIEETASEAAPVTKPKTEPSQESVAVAPAETEESANQVSSSASWHPSTKAHDGLNVDSILRLNENIIWNFSECTSVGASLTSDVVIATEADYGFVIRVADNDTVIVEPYDNTDAGIKPVTVVAQVASGDFSSNETKDAYEITGYSNCGNGIGFVGVKFSNDVTLVAGVFKEGDTLFAVNIDDNEHTVTRIVDARLTVKSLMDRAGITEKDCTYTDPIYYPIVPVNPGEKTDTEYWVNESLTIIDPDWSDAHKIMAIYNYIIDNMAYDNWVLSKGEHSRSFLYDDFTGTYFTSRTNVGVCEDFSQIFAIMCRAQGIPALKMFNDEHAMSIAYVEEYGRWIPLDVTSDLIYSAGQEDYTVFVKSRATRYRHLNDVSTPLIKGISIGNEADMKLQGIPTYD